MEKKYKIKYLPLFYNDLDQITDYIMYKLNNEIAGLDVTMYQACRQALLKGDYSPGFIQEPIHQPFM